MIELRTLGVLELSRSDGKPIRSVLAQPKRFALLSYLAANESGAFLPRSSLLPLFWPEATEVSARHSLSQALYFLRQALGADTIEFRGEKDVRLLEEALRTDATLFGKLVRDERWDEALDLYHGDYLASLELSGVPEFDRFLDRERARLRSAAARAAWALAGEQLARHSVVEAERTAIRALALDPVDEQSARHIARGLAAAGAVPAAVQFCQYLKATLAKELDLQPAFETEQLLHSLRDYSRISDAAATFDRCESPQSPRSEHTSTPTVRAQESPVGLSLRRIHDRPTSTDAGKSARSYLRAKLLGSVALLVLIGAALLYQRLSDEHLSSSPHAVMTRIAVFPFDVQGSNEVAYLGEGLMDLLSTALDGSGNVRRSDPNSIMSRIRREAVSGDVDIEVARRISAELGADHFVLGKAVELGNKLRISASLYDLQSDRSVVVSPAIVGEKEALADSMLVLARNLLASIRVGGGAWLESIGTIQTTDYVAFKAFLQGEALLRRGAFDSASLYFGRAVEADSAFALAWFRFAAAQGFGGSGPGMQFSLGRALQDSHRLVPRDRLLVAAAHAFTHGQLDTVEVLVGNAIGSHPDNVEAWYRLGLARMFGAWRRGGTVHEGREPLERAMLLDEDHGEVRFQLLRLALAESRYEDAKALMVRVPRGGAAGPLVNAFGLALAYAAEDRATQLRLENEFESRGDWAYWLGGWALITLTDSLQAARRHLSRLANAPHRSKAGQSRAKEYLAALALAEGRFGEARIQLARLAEQEPSLAMIYLTWFTALPGFERPAAEMRALRDSLASWKPPTQGSSRLLSSYLPESLNPWLNQYLLGLLHARLGEAQDALACATALEVATAPSDSAGLRRDLALEIRALVAARSGHSAEALSLLEQAQYRFTSREWSTISSFVSRPFGRLLRAELLARLGRDSEAVGWYEGLYDALYTTDFVFYDVGRPRMGEAYERLDERETAIRHYQRFVERWRHADAEYQPRIRAIEARLARLTSNGVN